MSLDRRKFIKNTALCACVIGLGKGLYDIKSDKKYYPEAVKIESCTLCQLSCPECWRNKTPNRMPLGYLKFEDFKKFVDKNKFIKRIDLSNHGEMFLNPELNKIIEYATQNNITTSAHAGVNLNTLSDETAELLVKANFGKMVISIDGASQEVYSVYRRGGDFNKVIENIKKIQFYQKKHNNFKNPKMVWKYIVFGHNEHEIPKAKQMAKELGIPIKFVMNYEPNYSPIKDIAFVERETGLDLNGINEDYWNVFFRLQYQEYINAEEDWFYCTAFFDNPCICFDGRFWGCCITPYDNTPDINVFETGLIKVLNRKEVKKTIDVFTMKDSDKKGTQCENCGIYNYLKRNNIKLSRKQHAKIMKKIKENLNG